jgi:tRNA A-37 threonylcarbamoyl transferase component Bud32
VVRIVRLHDRTYAVKETVEEIAFKEYRLLRDLQRLGLPAVVPQGVVTGRTDRSGEELPSALLTQHLQFSLPYRSLFAHGLTADNLPSLIDALVVLLVRLHLADFFWGDVSLSNVLFRRSAGGFAAYLVDAETGELRETLSKQMREYDLTIATENVFAELLDLQASESLDGEVQAHEIVELLEERYQALWCELTAEEEFSAEEMWRIEQRIERLNELGFDVEELDIVTDFDGDQVRIQPKVVELGHHRRELQSLTGLNVEDAQARRMLNDIASFTAHFELGREDRMLVANRWMNQIYEPIMQMVPPEASGKLEQAEVFHEILVHRWYLSERAGREVPLFEAARDYMENVLTQKPDEAVTADD